MKDHAFTDGNKRIGILVMITFSEINDIELTYTDDELINCIADFCGHVQKADFSDFCIFDFKHLFQI